MSKEKKDINEKIIDLMLMHELEETKHFIDFYENQLTFYNKMYRSHLEDEPFKLFKKKYDKWNKTRMQYYDRITEIEDSLKEELISLEKLMDTLSIDNKKSKKKKDKSN